MHFCTVLFFFFVSFSTFSSQRFLRLLINFYIVFCSGTVNILVVVEFLQRHCKHLGGWSRMHTLCAAWPAAAGPWTPGNVLTIRCGWFASTSKDSLLLGTAEMPCWQRQWMKLKKQWSTLQRRRERFTAGLSFLWIFLHPLCRRGQNAKQLYHSLSFRRNSLLVHRIRMH